MSVIVRTKYGRAYLTDYPDLWAVIRSEYAQRCEAPADIVDESTGQLLASLVYDLDCYWWNIRDAGVDVFGEPWS